MQGDGEEQVCAVCCGHDYFVYRVLGGVVTAAGWAVASPAGSDGGPWADALNAYFSGGGDTLLRAVPVDLTALSPFAQDVLIRTRRIPYGTVQTYRQIAVAAGRPRGARAAGQALGRNPVPVFIPCHRVVAEQGLGGFSSGVARKADLLRREGYAPLTPCRRCRL